MKFFTKIDKIAWPYSGTWGGCFLVIKQCGIILREIGITRGQNNKLRLINRVQYGNGWPKMDWRRLKKFRIAIKFTLRDYAL